jgi:asparagine synthase (glutamine-hydrolysing)
MCGIGGLVRYDVPTDGIALAAMRARLRHRGPDGEATHVSPHCGLVHTRLSLVDPVGGAQPFTSPDGRFVLVYNGEVYGLDALRRELAAGWEFRTRSDAEVVLAAYAAWGERCVHRLEGMFAFFVWDTRAEAGFAARDKLGVKPFVYAWDGASFAFASEAKALLPTLRSRPQAHREALLEVLVAPCFSGVESPAFAGMSHLPPGSSLRVSRAGVSVDRWWRYELTGDAPDDATLAARVGDALGRAVRRTLVADVPVGVFLSGGLDSTAIAAHAVRVGYAPRAFTVRFDDHARAEEGASRIVVSDDLPFALEAARTLALDATVVAVARDELDADLDAVAFANDALPAWEQEVAQSRLARAASRHVKAVLVGDAADETHFGYHFLHDDVATESPARILERFADAPIRRAVMAQPRAHFDAKYRALVTGLGHRWDAPRDRAMATACLVVERWLPRLLHNGDIHTMAHGLEARVPFADGALLDIARRVSPEAAMRGGVEKAVLREALRGVVPEVVRVRTKSALPKDLGDGRRYQRLCAREIERAGDLLTAVLDVDVLRRWCDERTVLAERERALLFRVVCLVRWARRWGVDLA